MRQECDKTIDRQDAVEELEASVALARHAVERYGVIAPRVTLPLAIAETVLACALDGMHERQGRRRPRKTRGDKLREGSIVAYARDFAHRRQRELMVIDIDQGKTPNATDAAHRANEEASNAAAAFAFERYGLSLAASTILRLMASSPKHFPWSSDVS